MTVSLVVARYDGRSSSPERGYYHLVFSKRRIAANIAKLPELVRQLKALKIIYIVGTMGQLIFRTIAMRITYQRATCADGGERNREAS